MFSGTFYFVEVTFAGASAASVSAADMQTAIDYATKAAPKISAYCRQYGGNQLSVHPTMLQYTASVSGNTYSDDDLSNWLIDIVQANGLASDSSAVVVLNPPAMTNTDGDRAQRIGGYHDHGVVAYAFVNVNGSSLTLLDTAGAYADALSHELAELVVDPHADWPNPEVCDPCAGNCNNSLQNFFDNNGIYLGSSGGTPPPGASYFIASIAKPASAGSCPAPSGDCAYAPPDWQPWMPVGVETFQQPTRVLGIARTPDDVDLFGIAVDGQVYTAWWHTGQQWAGWAVPAGGTFNQGTPLSGMSRDPLMVDLFAVGLDGNAYTAWWRGGAGWSGFSKFVSGSFSKGTPITPVARGEDSVDLFAVGEDGNTYTAWWRGASWSGFSRFASGTFSQNTPIAGVSKDGSSVDLFAVGEDGNAYTAWWRGQNWAGFAQFASGNFPQGTLFSALARDTNSVDVFAIGTDGQAYTAWWRGSSWSGFSQFASGNFTIGTPITGISRDGSSIDVFAVGKDGLVYTATWRGQGWVGFAPILPAGTFQQGTPVTAVAKTSGAIDLYAVGQDGRVYLASWAQP